MIRFENLCRFTYTPTESRTFRRCLNQRSTRGFVTEQPLSGSLVPHRASNVMLNCTQIGRQKSRYREGDLRAPTLGRVNLASLMFDGCSCSVNGHPSSGRSTPIWGHSSLMHSTDGRRSMALFGRDDHNRRAPKPRLIPGCSARLPFRPGGWMFQERHKGERNE
jgi:hypothetical protein